ncbi:ribonuclease HI [Desulfoprunum benzoelyticum]|uniref:Ribonuclease H n=1 Tax=Desulfoprunum benzoelyticum TaxID=1506996 RepID=A0A840V1V5_9BACT|nr:ribonuclease HI [Desulfoprunum benzoelyticum]MBB5347830.1 ribonuclease HI [Desulfoprunum benzoelyticum]MBM9530691.1 ribonuclease HI [Desulfoprunum benzoelyticum]
MGKKFYAVAAGREPGIYTQWPEAERQVRGFPGAKFKGFASRAEAEAWLEAPLYSPRSARKPRPVAAAPENDGTAADTVIVFTDGGCINNPGPGGYGVIIVDGAVEQELCGGFSLTTNNRMELMACIVALRQLEGSGRPVVLHSDSSYVVNGIEKGWARSWRNRGWRRSDGHPALNADLWGELLRLTEAMAVRFVWVKGHAGNSRNERCDVLATSTARGGNLPPDRGYVR